MNTSCIIRTWLTDSLDAEVKKRLAKVANVPGIRRIAVMPDVHLAGSFCVGTAIASDDLLLPDAVGGDIGCGILAVATDLDITGINRAEVAHPLLQSLRRLAPSTRHKSSRQLPQSLQQTSFSSPQLDALKRHDAGIQLGTLGSGNHFLELQADGDDRIWITVHTGSRGVGQAVRDMHLKHCERFDGGIFGMPATTEPGRAYLNDVAWSRAYARSNREAIATAMLDLLRSIVGRSVQAGELIHSDHNHVQPETHFGQTLWVHRKGAMPASDGEPGIIPGSMGTTTYHVLGRGCDESLRSSSHGAGRALTRTQAIQRISASSLKKQLQGVWYEPRCLHTFREEAPEAYRDVEAVMRAQRQLTRVVRELRTILVYKGAG